MRLPKRLQSYAYRRNRKNRQEHELGMISWCFVQVKAAIAKTEAKVGSKVAEVAAQNVDQAKKNKQALQEVLTVVKQALKSTATRADEQAAQLREIIERQNREIRDLRAQVQQATMAADDERKQREAATHARVVELLLAAKSPPSAAPKPTQTKANIRVAVLGRAGVGKTSLCRRFVFDTFAHEHEPTLKETYTKDLVSEGVRCFLPCLSLIVCVVVF